MKHAQNSPLTRKARETCDQLIQGFLVMQDNPQALRAAPFIKGEYSARGGAPFIDLTRYARK